MTIPESLLQRIESETGSRPTPATDEQLEALAAKNANGDTLEYYRAYNFYANVDCVELDQADANLDMMDGITPNCEVWQHGFISFARDLEGRAYCFDQNTRDPEGRSRIVRLSYTFGDDTSVEMISAAAEVIAPNLLEFLDLYLDSKVDSM
ncbi:MAG: hypothetical protein H7A51_17280 [Akkermansiaceae bacterium]|nr:hypothetical protein [Akkermansiaceae bacterium]